jgi:hypothetical protein
MKPPLTVAAIALPIVGGFYLGGPGLGMAVGALAAATIVVIAVRHPPLAEIVPPLAADSRRRLLVVLGEALDETGIATVATLVAAATVAEVPPEVLLISPCRSRFAERWTSDLAPGRHRAQENLVLSSAVLAKAGIAARGRVGDEDVVQMTEDELRSFPATEVVLVDGEAGVGRAAKALTERLRVPFHRIAVAEAAQQRGELYPGDYPDLNRELNRRQALVTRELGNRGS